MNIPASIKRIETDSREKHYLNNRYRMNIPASIKRIETLLVFFLSVFHGKYEYPRLY